MSEQPAAVDQRKFQEESRVAMMEAVKELSKTTATKLGDGLKWFMANFYKIIEYQGKELALLRTLENEIRAETLTETSFHDIINSLNVLRQEAQAENAAEKAKQQNS